MEPLISFKRMDYKEKRGMSIMENILKFLSIITIVFGIILGGNVLNSKSDLEQTFLLQEQKIKMYYYNLFYLSGILAFIGVAFYTICREIIERHYKLEILDWKNAISLGALIFICCLFSLGSIIRLIQNFLISHHFKYKVNLVDIGEVYILKMMNQETCICSKDPNAYFRSDNQEFILINLDNIKQQPLTRWEIKKPKQSFLKKLTG